MKNIILLFTSFLCLSSCGGGSESTKSVTPTPPPVVTTPPPLTGYFQDVSGLHYNTSSGLTGVTEEDGAFQYNDNDTVQFFHNKLRFGELNAKKDISIFSFKNPALVAQALYVLDLDQSPENGFQIASDAESQALFTSPGLTTTNDDEVYDFDTLDPTSESYASLVALYGDSIVSAQNAINTELYFALREASLTEKRFYKYISGDYAIPPGTRYDHPLVKEAQEDINNRIKVISYMNNFMLLKAGLSHGFSRDISTVEQNYNGFLEYTAEQLSNVEHVKAVLTSIGDFKSFQKTVSYEVVKYAIEARIEEAKTALGEGVYSDILDAQSKMLLGCIELAEENGLVNCGVDFTQAQIETLLIAQLEHSPVLKELGVGLTEVAAKNAKLYIACREVFALREVDLGPVISCLSKPFEDTYQYMAKIMAATNGVISIAKHETEFYSKDVAYSLIQDLAWFGNYSNVAQFLDVEDAFNAAEAPYGTMAVLLEAELKNNHPDIYEQIGVLRKYDAELAQSTYIELQKQQNKFRNFYTEKTEYQRLYEYNSDGEITGISDSYKDNYYARNVTAAIDALIIIENTDQSATLNLCFTIHNKGNRNVNVSATELRLSSTGGVLVLPLTFETNLSASSTSHYGEYCQATEISKEDRNLLGRDFLAEYELEYRNLVQTVDGNSYKIKAYSLYEGIDGSKSAAPSISLSSYPLSAPNVYVIESIIDTDGSYEVSSYHYDWTVTGGTFELFNAEPQVIQFQLLETQGNITLRLTDASGADIAEKSLQIYQQDQLITPPLLAENIYRTIYNQKQALITPRITGGQPPYSINFSDSSSPNLVVQAQTNTSITLHANNQDETQTNVSIEYTVVDSAETSVSGLIEVVIPPVASAEVGFIVSQDLPRTTPTAPALLGVGETVVKQWGLINTGRTIPQAYLIWDDNSASSLVHNRENISVTNWENGEIRIFEVPVTRQVSTEEADHGRWYLFHEVNDTLQKVRYSESKAHAYVSYTFATDTDANRPSLEGGVFIQPQASGLALSWRVASGDVEYYELWRSTQAGVLGSLIYSGEANNATDTDLTNGTTYYYTARACNEIGCADSNQDYTTYTVEPSQDTPVLEGGVFIQVNATGFDLSWREGAGEVDYYELWRSTSVGVSGELIYSGVATNTTDTNLTEGTTYYYTAKACNQSGCDDSNQDYATYTVEPALDAPELEGGVFIQTTTSGFDLSWRVATGDVDYYELWRSETQGVLGNLIYSGNATATSDTDLVDGETYYYTARACNNTGCTESNQDFATFSAVQIPELSGGVFIQQTESGFNLSWRTATGDVEYYELWRSESPGDIGSLIYTGADTQTSDQTINEGSTYYYTAKACNSAGCAQSNQDYSTFVIIRMPTLEGGVYIQQTDNGFDLSWRTASGNVEYYELWRSTTPGMTGNRIYKGNDTTTVDNTVSDNVTYYYTAKACNEAGCDESNQDFATFTAPEPPLDKPTLSGGVFIEQTNAGFELSWRSGSGEVEYYELWRSTSAGNLGSRVYSGSATYTSDRSLSDGVTYYYTAMACNESGCDESNQDYATYTPLKAPALAGGVFIQQTRSGFDLSWRTASGEVDYYELWRSTSQGATGTRIYRGGATNTSDTSVRDGVTYYYTAKACNDAGCDESNQDYSTFHALKAPTLDGGVFIQKTASGFDLSWRTATGEVDYYELWRSTTEGVTGTRIYSGNSTNTRDNDVSEGTTYYYTAKACNDAGCDASSQHYSLFD